MKFVINIFKILFNERSSIRFLIGILLGVSFSISIILATIGIMDGYESSLYQFIYNSEGHYIIKSKRGFFQTPKLEESKKYNILPLIESKGMAITKTSSVGILINGVNPKEYKNIFDRDLVLKDNSIVIGIELAKKLHKKVGDEILLSFLSRDQSMEAPLVNSFVITDIIDFGFFTKNMRLVLVNKSLLSSYTSKENFVNKILVKFKTTVDQSTVNKIEQQLDYSFTLESTLKNFEYLIKAVKAEKVMIIIVLQLIVIISVFNLYTFINFIKEKKLQEFFLLKSLGVKQSQFRMFLIVLVSFVWGSSCLVSVGFVEFYKYALLNFNFLKLPGDIYHFSRLMLNLNLSDYISVFSITLFWILFMIGFSVRKFTSISIGQGLKGELK